MPTGRTWREWWCIRHLRRASGCGLWRWRVALADADAGRSRQKISDPFSRSSQNVRAAAHLLGLAEPPPRSHWPNRLPGLSCPYPMLSMARLLRLARSSQPAVRGYQYSCTIHTCCASFGSSNQPITPVLRTTPPRKLQIWRNDAVSPPIIQ